MNHTGPDITCAVGRLVRYIHCPNTSHWTTLESVLKCLKGIMDYAINYASFPIV